MRPAPTNEWDESLRHIVADMAGRPLNVHALLANHPPLLNAWWSMREYLVRGGDLEQRQCELVILRIAARMHSWYEWASHVVRALDSGISMEEIDKVGREHAGWREPDAVLLDAVDELALGDRITPATLTRLGAHYTNRQILDVMHLHGMYATIARVINTWGLDLDDHVAERLPESVTPEMFDRRKL